MKSSIVVLIAMWVVMVCPDSSGSMAEPMSVSMRMRKADAVALVEVTGGRTFRDASGGISTRTTLRVIETFKGRFPSHVSIDQPIGQIGIETQSDGYHLPLVQGQRLLAFFQINERGELVFFDGRFGADVVVGAEQRREARGRERLTRVREVVARGRVFRGRDVRSFAAPPDPPAQGDPELIFEAASVAADGGSGLIETSGVPRRFLSPDQGEPIPVLVDIELLPPGITQEQALNALQNALDAWEAATSIQFRIEEIAPFGQAANAVDIRDRKIRVQLHDKYNVISNESTVVGIGGGAVLTGFAGFDIFPGRGGQVSGVEYHELTRGYIIVDHEKPAMGDLTKFEQTITHEIGHAIGLAHSSENENEPSAYFRDAIMYFRLPSVALGAQLAQYDIDTLRKSHPAGNTPPYTPQRVFEVVTAAPSGQVVLYQIPLINRVQIAAVDLQTPEENLTISLLPESVAGFDLNGNQLHYKPTAFLVNAPRLTDAQILAGTVFTSHRAFVRVSNGVHHSGIADVRAVAIWNSQHPSQSNPNGIPADWAQLHFGMNLVDRNADPDGDSFTNLEEFVMGTDPTAANSRLRVTGYDGTSLTWQARPFDIYRIERSATLEGWSPHTGLLTPLAPEPTRDVLSVEKAEFFRVRRVH